MYGYDVLHEEILDNLIKHIRDNTLTHAYIFEGERGIGSFEGAKLFANALVCEKQDIAPCGVCNACMQAKADTNPDIHMVSPKEDKKSISVEQIRELSKDAYTKPFGNKNKIYIISYGDEMNEQAQNAFLKLLEEPPGYAVFVILAENIESLLPTIRSRCEKIKFPPISKDRIKKWLSENYGEAGNAEFLARYANGNIEKAKRVAQEPDFMPLRTGAFEMLSKLLSSEFLDSYSVAEFVTANKDNASRILEIWVGFLRDIMLIQNDGEKQLVNVDYENELTGLSNRFDEELIVKAMTEIFLAQEMQRRYVSLNTLILSLAFKIKGGTKNE